LGYYALFYHVVEGFVERRLPFREAHLAHARHAAERGELALGGALAEPADTALIVFRGDSPTRQEPSPKKIPTFATASCNDGKGGPGMWWSARTQQLERRGQPGSKFEMVVRFWSARTTELRLPRLSSPLQ